MPGVAHIHEEVLSSCEVIQRFERVPVDEEVLPFDVKRYEHIDKETPLDEEAYIEKFSSLGPVYLSLVGTIPINVVCWRRALCLEVLEKADVLEYYDQVISSPSKPFAIPAVLRITDYLHKPIHSKVKLTLNRKNIFLRDRFRCQYCGDHDNLTLDHVIPVSRGGEWTWQNLVTACTDCNSKKGNKTLEESKMQLLRAAKEPRDLDGQSLPSNYAAFRSMQNSKKMPTEWVGYLPKRFQPMDYF
ncbi:hypothetical protein L7F22_025549 [Adiantum nelumboides]|nr:hypothetical protein [Adiantum nelumboides]